MATKIGLGNTGTPSILTGSLFNIGQKKAGTQSKDDKKDAGNKSKLNILIPSQKNQTNQKKDDGKSLNTFDISNVPSTVTNPSTKYKGLSKEDGEKIDRIVAQQLPNGSQAEIRDMTQGLYSIALNKQKEKDISANRENIIMELEYLASNSSGRQKSEYNTQIKRARLADLIRDTLGNVPMGVNDNIVIKSFLEENPEYNEEFRKFYYDDRTRTELGKDIGWIEKTNTEKVVDKIGDVAQGMFGWMPKFGEGVRDLLDAGLAGTTPGGSKEKDIKDAAFGNYVQEQYGTYPANLSESDYWEAMKEFNSSKDGNKAYTPTLSSAATKIAEGGVDIAATSTLPGSLIKLGFSIAGNTPYADEAVEAVDKGVSGLGGYINQIPQLAKLKDNLQTEEEKKDFDRLAGGWLISKFIKGKKGISNKKYITAEDVKNSIRDIKRGGKEAINDLKQGLNVDNFERALNDLWLGKEFAKENINSKITAGKQAEIQLEKEKQAQSISQGSRRTRAGESQELDILDKEGKLKGTKNPEQLLGEVDKNIDELKKNQESLASKNKQIFGKKELTVKKPQKQPDGTTKDVPTYPVKDAIKELINYYKDVDKVEAGSYKKLLDAYNKGNLSLKNILDIKREMNRVNNKEYGEGKILKDTKAAAKFGGTMEALNSLVDGLEFGDDIRKADARLSNSYILRDNLTELIDKAADVEKNMSKGLGARMGRTLARWSNKLSFGFNDFIIKGIASYLQASIDTAGRQNALEIYNSMGDMVKRYRNLLKKMENAGKGGVDYEAIAKDMGAFADQIGVDLEE